MRARRKQLPAVLSLHLLNPDEGWWHLNWDEYARECAGEQAALDSIELGRPIGFWNPRPTNGWTQ